MAYGFEFGREGNTTILYKTHNGQHQGENITHINGIPITLAVVEKVINLVNQLCEKRIGISLTLQNGESVAFCHNTIPDTIWEKVTVSTLGFPEWNRMKPGGLEASADGKSILQTAPRPGTQALKNAFPH